MNGQEKLTCSTHGISFSDSTLLLRTPRPTQREGCGTNHGPDGTGDILGPQVLAGAGAKADVFILQIITFLFFLTSLHKLEAKYKLLLRLFFFQSSFRRYHSLTLMFVGRKPLCYPESGLLL